MDLFEAIAKRHSYRGEYIDELIPREHLEQIVRAGIRAPSGKNEQTTSFVIVDDPEVVQKIAKIAKIAEKPTITSAKALIVCVVNPEPILAGISFALEDCAAAVENMLLAITALGYATVWMDGVLRFNNVAERVAEVLGVPDNLSVEVVLPLGIAKDRIAQAPKKSFAERASYNAFEQ